MFVSIKPEKIFVVIALFFGMLFAFVNPPFQAPDENAHLVKAWGFSLGSVNFKMQNGKSGQIMPVSLINFMDKYKKIRGQNDKTTFDEIKKYINENNITLLNHIFESLTNKILSSTTITESNN